MSKDVLGFVASSVSSDPPNLHLAEKHLLLLLSPPISLSLIEARSDGAISRLTRRRGRGERGERERRTADPTNNDWSE